MSVDAPSLPQLRATRFVNRDVRIGAVLVRLVLTDTDVDGYLLRLVNWREPMLGLIESDQALHHVGWTVY
jgi:hypothetical protein